MARTLARYTLATAAVLAQAQTAVWTYHNDNLRTGGNLAETGLSVAGVSSRTFGKLAIYPTREPLITQPLYLPGVQIAGRGARELVFAASAGTVYAFDTDAPAAPLWTVPLGEGAKLQGNPALDVASGTLYVAARVDGAQQRLHALDAASGAEKFGGPVAVPGAGADPAPITLANGAVFLGWSDGRERWAAAYDAQSLEQVAVFRNPAALVALEPGAILLPGASAPISARKLTSGRVHGGPLFWTSPVLGPLVYAWADGDYLKAHQVQDGAVAASPVMQNLAPGSRAWLALSAGGAAAGTGIVWALMSAGAEQGLPDGSAVLRAFDASDLTHELWNSQINPGRDAIGAFTPAAPPAVVNGRVFVPGDEGLHVFGLLEDRRPALAAGKTAARAATAAATGPNAIGIKFVGTGNPMGATLAAGVVPQTNWNNAVGTTITTPVALMDATGAASGASATWSSQVGWHLPALDITGNSRLMYGYIDSLGTSPTTVIVDNLPPAANGYTVYVYADGDNGSVTRSGAYRMTAGADVTTVNATDIGNFSGTFTQASNSAGNYVVFRVAGPSFTLTATPAASADRYLRAPLNAIQIVPSGTADFSLSVAPGTQAVTPGGSAVYTVNVAPQYGFNGTVGLSAGGLPAGATAVFSPSSVTGSGAATLTVSTTAGVPSGNAGFTITGISGGLTHTVPATLAVNTGPAAAPRAISIDFAGGGTAMQASEIAGAAPKANWNTAANAASAAPLALVDETGAATSATVTWSGQTVWSLPIADAPGNARMMAGYLDSLGGPTTVTVTGLIAGTYDVYVYTDGDNAASARTGLYQIGGTGIRATDPGNINFAGVFTQANNSSGNYVKFTVAGTGFTLTATPFSSDDAYLRAPVNGMQIVPAAGSPDFSLAATPAGGASFSVAVTAQNGFTGSVSLSASGLPQGATATFTPPTITGSGASTLTITGTTSANLVITGTSGSLGHSVQATLALPDFALAVAPAGGASFTVTVTAQNGFSGVVNLAATGLPQGATATFTPAAITGTGTSTLSIAGTTSANVTVTATSGALSHSAQATLALPDFTLAVAPAGGGLFNVTVAATNGFSGVVALSATGLPQAATATFTPASITGAGASTLAVVSAASATFTVTGTSGALVRSATATFTPAAAVPPVGISINFTGTSSAMLPTEIAGVVPKSNWNNAIGASRATPLAVVDEFGKSSATTITWSSQVSWILPITGSAGDNRMMSGYVDSLGTAPTTVTVAGLVPSQYGYNVYVYGDGANYAAVRTAAYTVAGQTQNLTDPGNTDFSGAYTQGRNYLVFFVAGTGFTLTAAPVSSTDAYLRSPLNGIQIVPAGPADFTVSAAPATRNAIPGGSASFNVSVSPVNGFSGPVSLGVSGLPSGVTATFNPAALSGSGSSTLTLASTASAPTGDYNLTVTAASGTLVHTAAVTLSLQTSLGLLTGQLSTPTGPYNLTALGTLDWAHWGYSFPGNYEHKAGVTPQIGNVTVYNGEMGLIGAIFSTAVPGFSWTDGAPDRAITNTIEGSRVMGLNKGFQFTAPADTTTRTLTIYLGAWNTIGRMVAHLTDGSAPDFVDTTIYSPSMDVQTNGVYTFTYRAASPGQKLVITYTMDSITGPRCLAWEVYGTHCYVTLQAATLQ